MSENNIHLEDDKTEIIKELDQNLLDHDYDGILELDNSLPPWWLIMFFGTIMFGAIYMGYYFLMNGPSQEREYLNEMMMAQEEVDAYKEMMGPTIDETNVELLTDASRIGDGKEIYDLNCIACHGPNGEGGVGPNLGDDYWIHGNSISDVFKTIKYGVPEKGMIPWESQLNPKQIQNVSSYIITNIAGSNPAGGIDPQGDLVE